MHATAASTGASALLSKLGACAAGAAANVTSIADARAEGPSFAQQLGRHSAVGATVFDLLNEALAAGPIADTDAAAVPADAEHAADTVVTTEPAALQSFIAQLLPVTTPTAHGAAALSGAGAGAESPDAATQAAPARPVGVVRGDLAAPVQPGASTTLAQTPISGTTQAHRTPAVPAQERWLARTESPAGPGVPGATRSEPGEPRAEARGNARAGERTAGRGTAQRHGMARNSTDSATHSEAATPRSNLANEPARADETDVRHAPSATALPDGVAVPIDAVPGSAAAPAPSDAAASAAMAPPREAERGAATASAAPAGPRSRLARFDHVPARDPAGSTNMTAPAPEAQTGAGPTTASGEDRGQRNSSTTQDRTEPIAPREAALERGAALSHSAQALVALTEPQGALRLPNRVSTPAVPNDVPGLSAAAAASPNAPQISHLPPVHIELAVPVTAPQFRDAFALQLSLLARDGVQHAQVHLNPAELGPISVQIALDGQQAQIHFGCDSAQTRQLVETGLPTLAAALRDAGFTLSGGGVSQHAPEQRQGSNPGAAERAAGLALEPDAGADAPVLHSIRVITGRLDTYA